MAPGCNQDRYFVAVSEDLVIAGVFDGHGARGHHAAEAASRAVRAVVAQAVTADAADPDAPQEAPEAVLRRAVETAHTAALLTSPVAGAAAAAAEASADDCGTTAVVAYVRGGRLLLANVGDSRAVLFRAAAGNGGGGLRAVLQTRDHSLDDIDELLRIGMDPAGALVVRRPAASVARLFPADAADGGAVPGLAMARALGHVVLSARGLSHAPDIYEADVRRGDCLVLASDGVWDLLTPADMAELLAPRASQRPVVVAKALLDAAAARAGGRRQDDATVVFIRFGSGTPVGG